MLKCSFLTINPFHNLEGHRARLISWSFCQNTFTFLRFYLCSPTWGSNSTLPAVRNNSYLFFPPTYPPSSPVCTWKKKQGNEISNVASIQAVPSFLHFYLTVIKLMKKNSVWWKKITFFFKCSEQKGVSLIFTIG